MIETLKLSSIRIDGDTQLRAETNPAVIAQYALDMQEGDAFPPIVVFHDDVNHWLSDGFHRYLAAKQIDLEEIRSDVRKGTRRDALLFATEANRKHGLPLTNEDKRRIVTLFLNDPEWSKWSDRAIARRCGVSQPFVSKVRGALTANGYQITDARLVQRGGSTYSMNTSNIGGRLFDPYEGLSGYLVSKLEDEIKLPSEDIASLAAWAREIRSNPKKCAGMAMAVGGLLYGFKTEGWSRDEGPMTWERLCDVAWKEFCIVPDEVEAFVTLGECEEIIVGDDWKQYIEGDKDVVDHLSWEEVENIATWMPIIIFRTPYAVGHYLRQFKAASSDRKHALGTQEASA